MIRVLLVGIEDEEFMRFYESLSLAGKSFPFQIFRTADLNETAEHTELQYCDLVVVPLDGGMGTADRLRKEVRKILPESSVILLSPEQTNLNEKQIQAMGFLDILDRSSLKPADIVRIIRYFNERKKLKKVLDSERAKVIQEATMTTLSEMFRGIAHEISNPLASLLSAIELMEEEDSDNKNVQIAHRSARRIERVIVSLRQYGKRVQGPSEPVASLEEAIKSTCDLCTERFNVHGIRFNVPRIIPKFQLTIDQRHFMQVLMSLIENSRDAIQGVKNPWVEVKVHYFDDHVRVSVIDSGTGIPEEIHDRIMEPFFSTKKSKNSLGLGLNAARDILEHYGGSLFLDRKEKDTTFRFTIPYVAGHKKQAA